MSEKSSTFAHFFENNIITMINAIIMAPIYVFANVPQEAYFHSNNASNDIHKDEPEVVSDETEKTPDGKRLFCRITQAAYEKGVAQKVDDDLRSACVTAPKLVKALRTNDALGYTDTNNLNSSDLYDMLNEHYGLSFKKHHFTVCRSK